MRSREHVALAQRDYSLVGPSALLAQQNGLAEAQWYLPPLSREDLRRLLERSDWPAARDSIIWFALLIGSGLLAWRLWNAGSGWAVLPWMIYGVLYASSSDSRWHESGHGTAFKTGWLNDALYEIASFMVLREATIWRWSHARHHSDTIILGRDPEIAVPRPPRTLTLVSAFFKLDVIGKYFQHLLLHCTGGLTAEEKTFIPATECRKVHVRAVIYLLIYAGVLALSIYGHSLLPLLFIGLPTLYGSWLSGIYSTTQHAGLAEDVLDHRLNTRTVHMHALNRFLYWNMNYHIEHHLYPLVPYYNLPRLHGLLEPYLPRPYRSLWAAWREIIPTLLRQRRDPSYCVRRVLPQPAPHAPQAVAQTAAPRVAALDAARAPRPDGWLEVCPSSCLERAAVIRFDHGHSTYAIYRTSAGSVFATDGLCTHAGTHLAGGLVRGRLIECPKHNGCFDIIDGSPQRVPARVALATYAVREEHGTILLDPRQKSRMVQALAPA
jgi:MocE subfamily Rieske [2Fe-2S] domain protein